MKRLGIQFTLTNGEVITVELNNVEAEAGAITGWWLYKDGQSRINEVVTAITYTRTANQP